ncbi:hypothetical protein DFA_07180 [Cavenderia fasciculata]|uniref:Ubiquitin-like protease family profile domain-containing protein n=1 Tax=Cavenderia fasciculata TaxID=261658 RepID=F4PVP9_CACFS|nr:uncharacterized protein DFA_07180 [Cavenderia fasciculata]EGG20063.1 hypothetical protein DFA_07180 [Cavenderia fasciculata]|eukprot:XP_004367046.1 hypothetical protein DFA_07180 [Cavenderia fasciculata]
MAEIVEEAVKQKVSLGESTLDSDSTICCLKLSESLFPTKREKYNKIYVRDCYIPVYDIISNHQALHGQGSIVLVKGNPGIGKSVFLFYYLYRKRSDPLVKSIIYDVVDAPVYHFTYTEDGSPIVHQGDRSSFKDILLRPDSSSLYLVDGQRPLPSKRPTLIVSSPNKSNYEEYMKDGKTSRIIMPLWSSLEILASNCLIFDHPIQDVQSRYFRWGGIPRYVLDKISRPDQELLVNAISSTNLEACISSINMPDSPESGSHKVIHLDAEPGTDFVRQRVSFASNYVKEKLVQRFYWNWREEVIRKVSLVGTSQIEGLLFEQLSHQTLINGGEFHIRSLDGKGNLGEYLHFAPAKCDSIQGTTELASRLASKNRFPPDTYVRPTDLNFPAVDSFMGQYLFQITKTNHPVSFKELNFITFHLDPSTKNPAATTTDTTTTTTATTTTDASTTAGTQFHLFFVVPPHRFDSFPRQEYVEAKTQPDANNPGKKTTTKNKVKAPQNVHQYALKMAFSSVPPSVLYPVISGEDAIINSDPKTILIDHLQSTQKISTTDSIRMDQDIKKDKRSITSALNLKKARDARKNQFIIYDSDSDNDSDNDNTKKRTKNKAPMMIGGKKQKQRPLRLKKDKRGRYIQHGVDRVYIRSKKNDKKLIRKLIREALDDERKQQQQLSKESSPVLAWSNPNEVAMIKSIQDANFRESVLKNQQELDKETKKKIIDLTKDDQQEIPILKKENDRFDQLEKRLSMLFEAKEEKLKRRQEKDDRSMEILYNQKLTEKRIQELEGKYENTRQIDEQLQSIIDMNNEMKEKNLLELERTIQANQVNQAKQTEQQQQIMVDQILPNDLIEMVPRNNLTATNDFVKEYLNSTMTSTKLSTNLGNELKDMVKNQRISVIDLIIGSGRSNKGLYDSEIERIMKPYHRKGFERVIASDQLNLLEPKDKMSFIMNLDPHNKPGSHWVAVYIDADKDKSVEYYDSFGQEPTDDFMKQLKDLIDEINPDYYLKFKVNKVIAQASNNTMVYHLKNQVVGVI